MNLAQQLIDAVKAKRKRIVIIGDVMIDRWVRGHLSSCQDGCAKFVRDAVVDTPGGAANAHNCLACWTGVEKDLFGQTGHDCPRKWRFLDAQGVILFRYDEELSGVLDIANYHTSCSIMMEMVGCADAVLISDYDKGFLSPEVIRQVIYSCNRRGIPCVADAKRPPSVYEGAIIKGNSDWQARYAIGFPANVIITRGQFTPAVNGMVRSHFGPAVQCVNHVGAGDCFAAHLTLALAYGFALVDAAAIAHSAGRVYVQHLYNRSPTPAEIHDDLEAGTYKPQEKVGST